MITREIHHTLRYFKSFGYAPTLEELHTYLKCSVSVRQLRTIVSKLKKQKKIVSESGLYTVGEYSIKQIQSSKLKVQNSQNKIKSVNLFVKLLSFFSQIKLIGLSGSVSMNNAEEKDDIDIFIITAENRLWMGRIIALTLAQLLGRRRKFVDNFAKDKICLNMFFDESCMTVPTKKRSEYVAHEVLQMKPLFVRDDVYLRYLDSNKWVYDIFPNARAVIATPLSVGNHPNLRLPSQREGDDSIADKIERLLKNIQLYFINKHKTSEIITDTQLWFFPEDFEKKLTKRRRK